jgi:hypothetical protein
VGILLDTTTWVDRKRKNAALNSYVLFAARNWTRILLLLAFASSDLQLGNQNQTCSCVHIFFSISFFFVNSAPSCSKVWQVLHQKMQATNIAKTIELDITQFAEVSSGGW